MGNDLSKTKSSGSHLDKEIAVLKGHSDLSEQEIRDLYEEFNYEAESGTGRMNKNQFRKYYKKVVGFEDVGGTSTDNAFAVFDTNHDGTIDFSEFVLATTIGNKRDLHNKLELAFAMIDTTGDEQVTFKEMAKFIEKALKLIGKDASNDQLNDVAADIYNQFGLDKEQKLNKKQFMDGCENHKELADIFGG